MKNLDKLLDMICSAEYEYISYDKRKEKTKVCYCEPNERTAIAGAISEWAMGQLTDIEVEKHIGELEAKVYAYEKIIANSNFAPMIQPTIVETVTKLPVGGQKAREQNDKNHS